MFATNVDAIFPSLLSVGPIYLSFMSIEWAVINMHLDMTSSLGFLSSLGIMGIVRLMRSGDEEFEMQFRVTHSVAWVASGLILWLAGGSTGAWTVPLNILMMTISSCALWFYEPAPRPNPLMFFLECIPVPFSLAIVIFSPPYAVAIPGKLLSAHPLLYTCWCGIGYPIFAFLFRKAMLAYFIMYFRKLVKEEKMDETLFMPVISKISFGLSTALIYGNVVLMYLSVDEFFAMLTSLISVFTETAGKVYAIMATRRLMDEHLKTVMQRTASGIRVAFLRAQAEAGVNYTGDVTAVAFAAAESEADGSTDARVAELMRKQVQLLETIEKKDRALAEKDRAHGRSIALLELELEANKRLVMMMRKEIERLGGTWEDAPPDHAVGEEKRGEGAAEGDLEGGEAARDCPTASGAAERDDIDEKFTEAFWKNQLCMFAIRWSSEIVAEKCCIINGAFTTRWVIKSPHSATTLFTIFAIFYCFEVLADGLLVYVLDKYFDVPFLRLPSSLHFDLRVPSNRKDMVLTVGLMFCINLGFLHAYMATHGLSPDVAALGGNATLTNVTLANITLANAAASP
jgi:hypothetical protein